MGSTFTFAALVEGDLCCEAATLVVLAQLSPEAPVSNFGRTFLLDVSCDTGGGSRGRKSVAGFNVASCEGPATCDLAT